jgi:hypothetical protein
MSKKSMATRMNLHVQKSRWWGWIYMSKKSRPLGWIYVSKKSRPRGWIYMSKRVDDEDEFTCPKRE